MSTSYANLVDPQLIQNNIDADYTNEARLVQSAIVSVEGVPQESSQSEWIKTKMFAGSSAQAVGVDTEITIQSKVQTSYKLPIVKRGNGGELDQTFEEIRSKAARLSWSQREVQEQINVSITAALQTNAAQGFDNIGISILDGISAYCKTNSYNYNDRSGNSIALSDLTTTMALRGEGGTKFSENGFLIMTGSMYQNLNALGLVAFSSNTIGQMKQDRIVSSGDLGTILGMRPFVTDKISNPDANDEKLILIEQGALRMLRSPVTVHNPTKIERRDAFLQEYYFRAGGIVNGFSWNSAKENLVTDTDLSTGTNYTVFAESNKNVPFAVLEVDE